MTGTAAKPRPHEFFSSRLRDAQAASGLANRELAKRMDISESLLGKWRRGESHPTFANVHRLALILDVPLEHFAPDDEPVAA